MKSVRFSTRELTPPRQLEAWQDWYADNYGVTPLGAAFSRRRILVPSKGRPIGVSDISFLSQLEHLRRPPPSRAKNRKLVAPTARRVHGGKNSGEHSNAGMAKKGSKSNGNENSGTSNGS